MDHKVGIPVNIEQELLLYGTTTCPLLGEPKYLSGEYKVETCRERFEDSHCPMGYNSSGTIKGTRINICPEGGNVPISRIRVYENSKLPNER